jgi:hypothetical protein
MPTAKYTDEKHIKERIKAKELYHERYKLKRKIRYICKKNNFDMVALGFQFPSDKDLFLHLKNEELQKQLI